jgi:hypothetical protein
MNLASVTNVEKRIMWMEACAAVVVAGALALCVVAVAVPKDRSTADRVSRS